MQIRIKFLKLENFQNIKTIDISFNENGTTVISGRNGAGKTTIANAISWLLFNCASDRTKSFSPKTVGADGKEMHNLNHIASAVFTADGKEFSLKKDFHENWVIRRGVTDADGNKKREFEGHETEYFVNGTKVRAEEYDRFLASMFSAEDAKILTLPLYFATQMDTKTRREKVIQLVGQISDDDILASDSSLADIIRLIKDKGNADNLRQDLKAEAKQLKESIDSIPVRISENSNNLVSFPQDIENTVESQAETLQAQIRELDDRKRGMTDSAAVITLKAKALKLKTEMDEIKASVNTKNRKINEAHEKEINDYKFTLDRLDNDSILLQQKLRTADYKLDEFKKKKKELAERIELIRSAEFTEAMPSLVCPACGQSLPQDKIDEIKDRHFKRRESFTAQKNEKLSQAQSQMNAEYSDGILASLEAEREDILTRMVSLNEEQESVRTDLGSLLSQTPETERYEDDPVYTLLSSQLEAIDNSLKSEEATHEDACTELEEEIEKLQDALDDVNEVKAQIQMNAKIAQRIKELNAEHAQALAKADKVKADLEMLDIYEKTKSALFERKQLSMFKNVFFSFISDQINGGQKDVCEPFIINRNGSRISFYKASTSEQINGGLKIIDAFSQHMNLSLPVVIDNAEAVNRIADIDGQKILLKVSDNPLMIEVKE